MRRSIGPATAADLIALLREAETHACGRRARAPAHSIAVLPFVNLSPDRDNEYFGDGIAEDIINALAQVEGLHVAARMSAFSFKGKNADLRTVGEQLNVATVLQGSVRKAGNRLRISAQLMAVADGYQLWSERYDRELVDVFAMQDEIARAIADRLELTLPERTPRRCARRPRRSKRTSWRLAAARSRRSAAGRFSRPSRASSARSRSLPIRRPPTPVLETRYESRRSTASAQPPTAFRSRARR